MKNKKAWVVLGDRKSEYAKEHEKIGLCENWSIIGWQETGDLQGKGEDEIVNAVETANEQGLFETSVNKQTTSQQLVNFCLDIKPGHIIVLPLTTQSGKVAVGKVKGDYEFRKLEKSGQERHTRKVEWLRTDVPRDDIRGMLFDHHTIFQIKGNAVECLEERINTPD